jgi:hypothetical protein
MQDAGSAQAQDHHADDTHGPLVQVEHPLFLSAHLKRVFDERAIGCDRPRPWTENVRRQKQLTRGR